MRKFEVSWYGVVVLRFALVTGVGLHGQSYLPDFGNLYCTDQAQQAETVLSAVLSIYIYIYIYTHKAIQVLKKALNA